MYVVSTVLRKNLGQQIGATRRAFRRHLEAAAEPYGLTATQFMVLRRLWEQDGLAVQQLARVSYLDAATMTGVLDRLEGKGLIQRVRQESDRRSVQIHLTEEGRALQAPLRNALDYVNQVAVTGLSPEEYDHLMQMLDRVESNLQAEPLIHSKKETETGHGDA